MRIETIDVDTGVVLYSGERMADAVAEAWDELQVILDTRVSGGVTITITEED